MPQAIRVIDQADEIVVDASGFSGNLGAGDTDAQTAFETIDGLSLGVDWTRIVIVDQGGNGDYTTIKAACDYVATQSPTSTTKWMILVNPGTYNESQFSVPNYTTVSGWFGYPSTGFGNVLINETATAGTFISMGTNSVLSWVEIQRTTAATTTGVVTMIGAGGSCRLIGVNLFVFANGPHSVDLFTVSAGVSLSMHNCRLYVYNLAGVMRIANLTNANSSLEIQYTTIYPNSANHLICASASASIALVYCAISSTASAWLVQTSGTVSSWFTNYQKATGTITHYDGATTTIPGLVKKAVHVADADGTLASVTAQFNALLDSLEAAGTVATS